MSKRKIAILGGGLGALSTAFHLTEQAGFSEHSEVTLYQTGWRLGGKCASSRGAHGRIEEHGLHVLLGGYENAFAMMRRCYAALDRDPTAPLATFEQAFKPHDTVVFQEIIRGELRPWALTFPRNHSQPGDGGIWPSSRDYAAMLGHWLALGVRILARELPRRVHPRQLARTLPTLLRAAGQVAAATRSSAGALDALSAALGAVHEQVDDLLANDDELRRLWILLDLGMACTRGMAVDRALLRGFDALDSEDFRDWMRRHGASEQAVQSALVRAVYDLVFHADADGRVDSGFGAGTALRMTLRFVGAYKGAVGWWMQAGTGETLIAPLYEVLRARGVRFAFFHRVQSLHLDATGQRVARVRVARQVTVRAGPLAYEPLVDGAGLPCWPHRPDTAQLVEGAALGDVDLESTWSGWRDVGAVDLIDGVDFDDVVLAISHAALPALCAELADRLPRWRDLLGGLQTTPTVALQVWSHTARAEGKPMMNTGHAPLTGYGDMSHLVPHEAWPAAHRPGHVLHVCNRLETPPPPPATDVGYHQRADADALALAEAWLSTGGGAFIPGATQGGALAEPAWDVLVDPAGGSGRARLHAQFWCANVEPTDRYVLSAPGTVQLRLRADESGVDNLVLAGAWLRTGLNLGAVESAVMSGMQASRALTGVPRDVWGERDFR